MLTAIPITNKLTSIHPVCFIYQYLIINNVFVTHTLIRRYGLNCGIQFFCLPFYATFCILTSLFCRANRLCNNIAFQVMSNITHCMPINK